MAFISEVNYFNCFTLDHTTDQGNMFYIEESRIYGGYNNTSVDLGVKAYTNSDFRNAVFRKSAIIYSGPINNRTGVNSSNEFSVAEDITKGLDPALGSIQRLYAEDSNLTIFQEEKVSRALIDKDAIYSAEGNPLTTASNRVIGQITPYAGEYGISKDPGSFAVNGYRKYFTDRNKGIVCRLSMDGITEISQYGLKDYFRDVLKSDSTKTIHGSFNSHDDTYMLHTVNATGLTDPYSTISFKDNNNGWVAEYDYNAKDGFSYAGDYFNVNGFHLYKHNHAESNTFDGDPIKSSVHFIVNPNVIGNKTFTSISYIGTSDWGVESLKTKTDEARPILSSEKGMYDSNLASLKISKYGADGLFNTATGEIKPDVVPPINYAGFVKKDNKFVSSIRSKEEISPGMIPSSQTAGVKGDLLEVIISKNNNGKTDCEGVLFSVITDFNQSQL